MRQSNEEVSELIQQFAPLICWKVGLHYGSMIYFEMKERTKQKMLDGTEKEVGSCRLSISADNWQIHQENEKIITCNSIKREFAENELREKFVGERMNGIKFFSEKMLLISFTSNLIIALGVNGQREEKDDLFRLFFPDGTVFAANKSSGLYRAEQSEPRV